MALGTLKQLEVLELKEVHSGDLTMEGIHMLIEHCPFLKRIKGLRTWSDLNPELVTQLKDEIKSRNFDLEIED
jgi:hypothetical protein